MQEQKSQLRKAILKKLQGFNNLKESELLLDSLKKLDVWKRSKNIMIYTPMAGEIDLFPLLKEEGKFFYFPKILSSSMEALQAVSENDFIKRSYDILEPKAYCKKIEPKDLDIIVVPGVAFDKMGNRLGRGKGYYDKFLAGLRAEGKTTIIALVFSCQIVAQVPVEEHDEKIDMVISV
jgi:5-formyltetrahydrofolate cyclo-ligase